MMRTTYTQGLRKIMLAVAALLMCATMGAQTPKGNTTIPQGNTTTPQGNTTNPKGNATAARTVSPAAGVGTTASNGDTEGGMTYKRFTHKQKNVDYNAIPDADNVPPVRYELGIPNGNARNVSTQAGLARSKGRQVRSKAGHADLIGWAASTGWTGSNSVSSQSNSFGATEADGQLPNHWNNGLTKYFPPFFYQSGPSCMGSAFTGYMFTHELNALRGLDGALEDNQMAIFFGWLLTYQNTSKEDVEMYNGCPSATDYGGRTNSDIYGYYDWRARDAGWMQGYDKWHRAMYNRAQGFYTFPYNVGTETGRQALKRWLYNHNGDTDFLTGGVCYIVVGANSPSGTIQSTPANDEAGVVGLKYIEKWAASMNHALTIIGYDDRIEFDLNGDGVYGDEAQDEKGAWVVANSWGEYWGNGGWTYVPYRYGGVTGTVTNGDWWTPYVTYARKNYRPKRTLKLLMDYDHRSELSLSVGINKDTAATVGSTVLKMAMFQNAGDGAEDRSGGAPAVPMLGKWADGQLHDEPMEFGYDLTDLSSGFDNSEPLKYFFNVHIGGKLGKGHILKASVVDYNLNTGEGVEIPFPIDTVTLDPTENTYYSISVIVQGEKVNAPVNARLNNSTLTWGAPMPSSLRLKRYYIYQDNVKVDSVANTLKYKVDDPNSVYTVSAAYDYMGTLVESEQSNTARLPFDMPTGANQILRLNGATLVIPNAVTRQMPQGTIEFWIKPHVIGKTNHRISGTDNDRFFIGVSASGQVQAGWGADNMLSSPAKSVRANVWTHVALVVENNKMTLYLNGMKKASATATVESGLPGLGTILFGTSGNLVDADIDELRIWRTARTQIQIFANKDNTIADPTLQSDLLTYIPMNTLVLRGDTMYQDFARGNNAYIQQGDYLCVADSTILGGGKFAQKPSVSVPNPIYANQTVRMTGDASLTTVKWAWNMPGATPQSATVQSPYVVYKQAGKYPVVLTVTDPRGVETSVEDSILVDTGSLPAPEFDLTATRMAVGKQVSFINRTLSPNCTYRWDIQGQSPLLMTNGTTTFDTAGTYNITLTATNAAGSASLTKQVEIYETAPSPQFNIAPANIFLGETTYLEDHTPGRPSDWIWTLSNGKRYVQVMGQYSSLVPPAPGYYDVSLQTANGVGANILTRQRALCVSNADAKNGLNFTGLGEQIVFDRPFAKDQPAFTVEWWMNPSKLQGAGGMVFGPFSAVCNYRNRWDMKLGTRGVAYNGSVTTGEWHHYAITYANERITLYVDGQSVNTMALTSTATQDWGDDKFRIGRSDNPMNACIDEFRIWDKALSKDEIQAVCNSPVADPANTDHLCLYYDFNQNGGDVIDRTGHGYDAARLNFGPDGDAWITQRGVFTLDLGSDIQMEDVAGQYLTNYKAPFLHTDVPVNRQYRKSAYALQTGTEQSGWIFRSPVVLQADTLISTVYVDTLYSGYLYASSGFNFGRMSNQRLWQTVSLPEGHYRFAFNEGNKAFSPGNSRIVVCIGDSIVDNANIDNALVSCLASKSRMVEFDVPSGGSNVSLGLLYNMVDIPNFFPVEQFYLYKITSTTQIADDVHSVYDAVEKGLLDNVSGENGAVRVVSNEPMEVKAYTAGGRCVFNQFVSGNKRIPLPAGIYIVNGKKVKVY